MGESDPSSGESLLIRSGELENISKGGDLNGAFDSRNPNCGGDAVGGLEDVGAARNLAVLEVPPDGDWNCADLVFAPPMEVRRRRGGG